MTFQVRKPGAGQFFISRFYGGFNFFYFSRPALHVSQNGWIQFSKAGISGIKTGRGAIFQKPVLRGFQFFQSRRFAPETAYGGFNFFKAGASRLKTAYGGFNFFKAGASRLKTAYGGFNFFQSRRFASQNRLRRFHFFFKAGASRLKTAYGGFNFFQSRRFAPKIPLKIRRFAPSKPCLLFAVFGQKKNHDKKIRTSSLFGHTLMNSPRRFREFTFLELKIFSFKNMIKTRSYTLGNFKLFYINERNDIYM